MRQTISVTGMTCQNCVRHVIEALASLPGVRSTEVDLQAGSASLDTDREVPAAELAHALEEAGYNLG
jgi:P-type Cu+ transporter